MPQPVPMPRGKKAMKQAQVSSESDTDGEGDAEVLPSEAYQQLLKVLGAETVADTDDRSTHKRQKVKHAADQSQAAFYSQKQQKPGKPSIKTSESEAQQNGAQGGQSTARQSSGDVLKTGNRKKRGANKADDDDFRDSALEAAPSMQRHLDRQLSEADIPALRNAKLEKDCNPDFAAAWTSGEWLATGDPLPEQKGKRLQVFDSLEAAGIRNRLVSLWREAHGMTEGGSDFTSPQQKAFFALARSYKDVLLPAQPYPQSSEEEDELLDAALLHCIEHVVASSHRIKKANESLKANPELDVPRDQGFTRPKVLLLLPMRNVALKVVKRLLQLAQKETRADSVQGKERFLEEFGDEAAVAAAEARSPADHAVLFAGDTDDHFRFGVKITKGAIKLYADFFQSDIIVASPIGLVTKQAEGGEESTDNLDFLSSIEIALLPRCDVLLMQNWAHVVTVFEGLNKLPAEAHGANVMRVYDWCLAGNARLYRQTILLSSFLSPEMNALFAHFCCSHAGKAKLRLAYKGVLARGQGQLQQMFDRFKASSPAEEADARFEHFQQRVWPRIRDSGSGGQFIFVPSYFDYVRLRGFLTAESVGFEGLSEYASGSEVARGKRRFTTGKTRVALYTERSHFYHRRKTKGIKDLYVYQLPEHAQYYAELLDMTAAAEGIDAGHTTVTVLFSKLDALRLERVVGSSRARSMLKATTSTFLFC